MFGTIRGMEGCLLPIACCHSGGQPATMVSGSQSPVAKCLRLLEYFKALYHSSGGICLSASTKMQMQETWYHSCWDMQSG